MSEKEVETPWRRYCLVVYISQVLIDTKAVFITRHVIIEIIKLRTSLRIDWRLRK